MIHIHEPITGTRREDSHPVAEYLNSRADEFLQQGDTPGALKIAREALERARNEANRKETARALCLLSHCYWRMAHYDRAMKFAQESLALYRETGDQAGIAGALVAVASVLWRKGKVADALKHDLEALQLFKQGDDLLSTAVCLNNIGLLYRSLEKFDEALRYFRKSLRISRAIASRNNEAFVLNNIGSVFIELEDYDKALGYFEQSLKLKLESGSLVGQANAYNNIALVYLNKEQNEQALEYLLRCLPLYEQTQDRYGKTLNLNSIGRVLGKLGRYDEAVYYARESLKLARSIEDKAAKAESLRTLAELLMATEHAAEALPLLTEAREVAEEFADKNLIERVLKSLSENYKELGEFRRALEIHERYHTLHSEESARRNRNTLNNLRLFHQMEHARREADGERLRRQELENRNRLLEKMNTRLKELNLEKSEILSIAAHDLKNPLAGIMMGATFVRANSYRMSEEERAYQLEQIVRTADRMHRIISNILDLNAIEFGKVSLQPEEFDACKLAEDVCREYTKGAAEKDITLHFAYSHHKILVISDRQALFRILDNLLSNAVKYSPLGRDVCINLTRRKNCVRFEIRDDGPGFTESDKERLFCKFSRLSAQPTAGEHSTGLGLSIVRKLVDNLKGHVWCESEFGKGAVFTVEIPYVIA